MAESTNKVLPVEVGLQCSIAENFVLYRTVQNCGCSDCETLVIGCIYGSACCFDEHSCIQAVQIETAPVCSGCGYVFMGGWHVLRNAVIALLLICLF